MNAPMTVNSQINTLLLSGFARAIVEVEEPHSRAWCKPTCRQSRRQTDHIAMFSGPRWNTHPSCATVEISSPGSNVRMEVAEFPRTLERAQRMAQ